MTLRLGVLTSHPIQYQAPLFRELAQRLDLKVFFAHRQTARDQARADFGVEFDWDVDLLSGYEHRFLVNCAPRPDVSRFSGCDTPEIAREIAEGRFDAFLVTGWYLKSHWQAIRACRRLGTPVMVRGDSQLGTPRSSLRRLAAEVIHRWIVSRFDALLYVGQRNREYLEHFGARPERLFFSPHCVDNEWFRTRAEAARPHRERTRAELGCPEGGRLLLFVGKLIDKKRPMDLVEAAALLRDREPPVAVAFVGTGPLEGALREQAGIHCVRATFPGFRNQSELPAIYAVADALVLPSSSESWGLAVNEAMACGTPAVVSDAVGCAPDLVRPGETGEVYPCGDVSGLAAVLGPVLEEGLASRGAVAAVAEQYSVKAAAEGVIVAASTAAGAPSR